MLVVQVLLPVERGRAVVGQQFTWAGSVHSLRKFAGKADVWHTGFAPDQVGVRRIGNASADGLFQTVFDTVETFLGALTREEWFVVGIVVAGHQVGGLCVCASQHDGGYAHHVCGEAGSDEFFASLMRWHQDFAAHVAALLDGRQLVFEVHASCS